MIPAVALAAVMIATMETWPGLPLAGRSAVAACIGLNYLLCSVVNISRGHFGQMLLDREATRMTALAAAVFAAVGAGILLYSTMNAETRQYLPMGVVMTFGFGVTVIGSLLIRPWTRASAWSAGWWYRAEHAPPTTTPPEPGAHGTATFSLATLRTIWGFAMFAGGLVGEIFTLLQFDWDMVLFVNLANLMGVSAICLGFMSLGLQQLHSLPIVLQRLKSIMAFVTMLLWILAALALNAYVMGMAALLRNA